MHEPSRHIAMIGPVNPATAFAELYQRWFDDARGLAESNRRKARNMIGSTVADVLALWDERARSFLPGGPTILRFEERDLAVFSMRTPHIALFFGSVETDAPVATLRWKSLVPCSYIIGRQVCDLVAIEDEDGLLVGLEAILDDGGRFAVGEAPRARRNDARALPRAV